MPKWRLVEVTMYDRRKTTTQKRGEVRARFVRETPRRGDKRAKVESITIAVETDGLTKVYRNWTLQSMKANRRDRAHAICCQAVAYYEMMETIDGFPEQETLL